MQNSADVGDTAAGDAMMVIVKHELGRPDTLENDAAFAPDSPVTLLRPAAWREMLRTDVDGVHR